MSLYLDAPPPNCLCCQLPEDLFLPENYGASDEPDSATVDHQLDLSAAFERLKTTNLLDSLVDTHGHAHLAKSTGSDIYQCPKQEILSLTCAVHPDDWGACIEYAAQSPKRMLALGVHPWYLGELPETWLEDLEEQLKVHPHALVGEIGLCKMARFVRQHPEGKQAALEIQRSVFAQQLELAARYRRPVSIHCVNQQSILLEQLQKTDPLPPAIALHSFSGSAHQVKQLVQKIPNLFFGFSHAVNCAMSTSEKDQKQACAAIRAVPADQLLLESDLHHTDDVTGGTVLAAAFCAAAREEPLEQVVVQTQANARRFLRTIRRDL